MKQIDDFIDQHKEEFIGYREHIHEHPELSFEEYKTSEYIQSILAQHDIPYEIKCETGIVAYIDGGFSSTLAMRADLDALPIQELNDVDYRSQNDGVMHACGHDVHTSCLLGAAISLQANKNLLDKNIKFIFQPGEEKQPGGASLMIKAGVLDNVDAIIALHVYPHLSTGELGFKAGQYMASTDEIYIDIIGKGGHAAMPHLCVDPIVIAAEFLVGVQQVISRKKNPIYPSVLTFGKIEAGNAPNVIPDSASIAGTLRCMNEDWRKQAHELIRNYLDNLCEGWGAQAEIDIRWGYPSLYNDPDLTYRSRAVMEKALGKENVKELDIRMTAEDFSYYTHNVPGCFYRLGTNKAYKEYLTPVHNPHFDINADAIEVGVKSFCDIALNIDLKDLK